MYFSGARFINQEYTVKDTEEKRTASKVRFMSLYDFDIINATPKVADGNADSSGSDDDVPF